MNIAKDFKIDAVDYAGQGNAILGIRDAGKTYTAMKAAEELLDAGIPIIVYDPVGVWKNLKVGIGKNKGYPIVTAGGPEADIHLTVSNAVDIVRAAMKENVSLVIDLYSPELINKSTWIKVVQETVDLLMYENKNHGMRHIFIEEAAEFIPQRLQPQHAKVYASIERLARMGRNARLGYTIINQRAEEVNKAILEISELTLLHKQVGKNSLLSVQKWLDTLQVENKLEIVKSLPTLTQGQCWVIGMGTPKLIQISPKKTFHPNPKRISGGQEEQKKITDVSSFVEKLNRQLIKPEQQKVIPTKTVIASGDHTGLEAEIKSLKEKLDQQKAVIDQFNNIIENANQITQNLFKVLNTKTDLSEIKTSHFIKTASAKSIHLSNHPIKQQQSNSSGSVTGGAMRMLKAAAMFHPKDITRIRMGALARLSNTSGSFGTYLSTLIRNGYLVNAGKNIYSITKEGLNAAGDVEPLPTDPQVLIELWCDVVGAQGGAARMLRTLGKIYPKELSREELGHDVGMSSSSGSFGTYLSTLKRNGLIKFENGHIKAADELFN